MAIVLILGLMFIVRFGQRLIMRVMSTGLSLHHLAYFMALFLIPHWNGAILQTVSFSATGDTQDHIIPVDDLPGTGDVV